jgi:hypothetical protein
MMMADGPALTALAINDTGPAAHGLSKSGSDRQEIFVRRSTMVSTCRIDWWVKFASIAWVRDGSGLLHPHVPGAVARGRTISTRSTIIGSGILRCRSIDFRQAERARNRFRRRGRDDDRWTVITAFQGRAIAARSMSSIGTSSVRRFRSSWD